MKKHLYIILSLFLFCSMVHAQETGSLFIQNGYIIPVVGDDIPNGDVYIKNGKIEKIGTNLSVPSNVEVIDAEGLYVMPGIIDAHSHAGIDVVNEATSPNTAMVAVGDAINPYDIHIYRALAGGVTISHAMHGSANVIGGQCQTLKHRYGNINPNSWKMEGAPRTIKFALGENPMRVHGQRQGIIPNSRMGVEQVFRRAFAEAKDYKKSWSDFQNGKSSAPPLYDLRLETMSDILDGDILIHCHSYRADEIVMLLNVLKDNGVDKICFQHVNEGFKVAPELAEFGATASIFADWWAYKFEVYYSTAYNAAILTKNGVTTSINSDDRELIRHLNHEAAKAQKYGGLTDNESLKLITLNPAIQLGIDKRAGSLEVGKDGDIAIYKNHPLSVYAICQKTIVDGITRFDIKNDPNDMRLYIDPNTEMIDFTDQYHLDRHQCMEGAEGTHSH